MQQLTYVFLGKEVVKNSAQLRKFYIALYTLFFALFFVLHRHQEGLFQFRASSFLKPCKFSLIRSSKQSALAAHFSLTGGGKRGMRVSLTNVRGLSPSYHPTTARGWIGETRNRISRAVHRGRDTLVTNLLVTYNVRFLFPDSREPEVG